MSDTLPPIRALAIDQRHEQLRGFSCGRQGRPWETLANAWAARLHEGSPQTAQVVLVQEGEDGQTVGLLGLKLRRLPIDDTPRYWPCVHRLGVDWRRQRTGIGRRLLDAAIARIQRWPGCLYVWAFVDPANEASHALFSSRGFALLPPAAAGRDAVRLLELAA